jgi:hypothetical protein
MAKLNELDLRWTQVTDSGLMHLTELTKLQLLHVGETQVTAAGAKELKRALPACFMPPYTE